MKEAMEEVNPITLVWSMHKSIVFVSIYLNMGVEYFFSSYKHDLIKDNMEL